MHLIEPAATLVVHSILKCDYLALATV
jgi:hypothetical protein